MRQSALETEKAANKKELAGYAETNKKIAAIKKKIAGINKKLNAIKTIEKNRQGPVRLLDEIAKAVPKNKLWLRSLSQKKGAVTLEGAASDYDVVALYMKNLEKMKSIASVDLKSTTLKHLQKQKVNVFDFVLNLKTTSQEKKPTPSKKRSSKRKK
jgi:type IV pilus assembly protein PilN